VFGVLPKPVDPLDTAPIDGALWGEPDPEEEDEISSEEEEEEEEEEATETATDGLQTPSGLETPSGMQSVMSSVRGGLETPDFLELRKGRAPSELSETPLPNRSLYQVLPEKQTAVRGLVGSERGYDVSAVSGAPANVPVLGEERASKRKNGVDVTIDSSELEGLSEEQLRAKYEAASRGNSGVPGAGNGEDFGDMIAREMAKKKQKMDSKAKAKEKEYKF